MAVCWGVVHSMESADSKLTLAACSQVTVKITGCGVVGWGVGCLVRVCVSELLVPVTES